MLQMVYTQIVSFKLSFIPKTLLLYKGVAADLEEEKKIKIFSHLQNYIEPAPLCLTKCFEQPNRVPTFVHSTETNPFGHISCYPLSL